MKAIKKILIAEDELLIAKVLRLQLEKNGFTVDQVADGNAVYEKVVEMKPDLIIMDVFLKNRSSGLDAARKLRNGKIIIPIIFTTGNSFEITNKETAGISNSFVLTKPVELFQITRLISDLQVLY